MESWRSMWKHWRLLRWCVSPRGKAWSQRGFSEPVKLREKSSPSWTLTVRISPHSSFCLHVINSRQSLFFYYTTGWEVVFFLGTCSSGAKAWAQTATPTILISIFWHSRHSKCYALWRKDSMRCLPFFASSYFKSSMLHLTSCKHIF